MVCANSLLEIKSHFTLKHRYNLELARRKNVPIEEMQRQVAKIRVKEEMRRREVEERLAMRAEEREMRWMQRREKKVQRQKKTVRPIEELKDDELRSREKLQETGGSSFVLKKKKKRKRKKNKKKPRVVLPPDDTAIELLQQNPKRGLSYERYEL